MKNYKIICGEECHLPMTQCGGYLKTADSPAWVRLVESVPKTSC
jgi:hypothetical protein